MRRDESQRVYSTGDGDLRKLPAGRRPPGPTAGTSSPPADGIVRVGRTRSGKRGKVVTEITGLPGGDADLAQTLTELKRLCGSGGTLKHGVMEVQGDHRDRIAAHLGARGHRVKTTGS